MNRWDKRVWLATGASVLLCVAWATLTLVFMVSDVPEPARTQVADALASRWGLAVVLLVPAGFLLALAWQALFKRHVAPVAQLAELARVAVTTGVNRTTAVATTPALTSLATTLGDLLDQRRALQADVQQQVAEASARIEEERNRLAALMSELTQSVVVCNLDGRILLYNNRARLQFRALSNSPQVADGAEIMGIGRSIYAAFDQRLVVHALENIRHRMAKGAAHPTAQFVTTSRSGQLLRVQMTPVRGLGQGEAAQLGGFVLMLENITKVFEEETRLDTLIHTLTERSCASLANLRAAVEMLDFPDLDAPMRERFQGVVRDELTHMGQHVAALAQQTSAGITTRWPLEEMLASDLLDAAEKQIAQRTSVRVAAADIQAEVWLKVDSYAMLQMLGYLAERLVSEFEVRFLQFRLDRKDHRVHLDLVWSGQAMSTETVMTWEMDPMRTGTDATPMTVRDVVARHGGEMWFERDRARHQAFFRFSLPLPEVREASAPTGLQVGDSRPEYYDFDLFHVSDQAHQLDDRRLEDLVYTVFDTETTGLNPSEGDEIIQIGATRIVNNRLLKQESFDQLVDPRRPIPAHTIPIHGITPEMVEGKPHIGQVLPTFHAFATDTVLVAHNAAFDMKFLALKEQATGLRFDQPVLDTLLLSAVVHPQQTSHRLEAIAERFNITVTGRHTALGDAMVTAEVFLRLIPLLADQGIVTLKQAREAAEQTYYARLKY